MSDSGFPSSAFLFGVLAVLYLALSVFQASARALARERASHHPGWEPGQSVSAPPRLLLAVQSTRQACLVAGALLLARLFVGAETDWPEAWAFALTFLVFTIALEQVCARSVALLWPAQAYRLTLWPARILSAPMLPLVAPVHRMLVGLRDLFGGAGASEDDMSGLAGEPAEPLREAQGEIIENVKEFPETIVREIMTPRTEMITTERTTALPDLLELVTRSKRSRIPVTEGGADHVVGMVLARDLLALWSDPPTQGFDPLIRPVLAVPETKGAFELLREMQAQALQMAIVVDEYGGTAGLVTIEDLIEELVGDIADEHEARRTDILGQQDGSWLVRGSYPVFDLADRLGVTMKEAGADSVGGLIVAQLGRLPEPGESVEFAGMKLEVAEADRRRVRRVRVQLLPPGEAESDDESDEHAR